ncbi:MAG: argininosuccinate synthase [Coriobacteriia bacterium]|nr:argininosuccinate synthase [Coriobacteriia bacterium]
MAKDICVLAYSGGLDTSVCLRWLMDEKGLDVVCVVGEVGQEHEGLEQIRERALQVGAKECIIADMREDFANNFLTKALAANAMFENKYPLLSALSRPLISKYLVDIAHQFGAKYVAHGCTGKGNDQVRFETSIRALDPSLEIIAPVREWDMHTRAEEMEWAQAHGVPVPTTKKKPYSIDDNMWGRAIECGVLEDPMNRPPLDIYTMTKDIEDTPDEPTEITISFKAGVPTAIDGKPMSMQEVVVELNKIAGENGYGRIDMIENRMIGVKSRECYECPAGLALIEAHRALEDMCLEREVLRYKLHMEHDWAINVYNGQWFSPLKHAMDTFMATTQQCVTGNVRVKFHKGNLVVTGRESDYSLYDYGLATYDAADTFDHKAAKGFIDLYSLSLRVWAANRASQDATDGE